MKHLTSYHGHRAEYPTPGQAWTAVAMIAIFAALGIWALFAWALA